MGEAENYLQELNARHQMPATPQNTFGIANALWNLGRYSEAVGKYNERAAMGGSPEEVYCSLWRVGECGRKLGKPPDEVASALYRAYFFRPTRFEALVSLCLILRDNERFDLGYRLSMVNPTQSSDTLLVDRSAEWQILEEHALAALHLDHLDEAREYFDLVAGYNLSGDDRERIEENIKVASESAPEETLSGFENAAKVIFPVKLTISSLEETAQHQDLAYAKKQSEIEPSPGNFLRLSLAYYRSSRPVDCIHAAQKAIELKPDFAEAFNNIAAAHLLLSEWDAAIAAAREAIRINPNFQLAKNNLAAAEEKRGLRKKTRQ
jgi:tetratricopeptide (TPR) repeat protein